jgi:hypothetical protein
LFVDQPFWASHFDFDHLITLEPNHDYWLWSGSSTAFVCSRACSPGREQDFTANIGPSFRRTSGGEKWIPSRGRALCSS